MSVLFYITALCCAWALAEYAFRLSCGQTMLRDEYSSNKLKKEHTKKHKIGMVADAAYAAARLRRHSVAAADADGDANVQPSVHGSDQDESDDGAGHESKSSEPGAPPQSPGPLQRVRLAALGGVNAPAGAALRN